MTRPNSRQRRWAKDSVVNTAAGAKLNCDGYAARRKYLWDRALAAGMTINMAAKWVGEALRAEFEGKGEAT